MNEDGLDARAICLLGLNIKWDLFTPQEQQIYLKSPQRIKAFNNIGTNTNPQKSNIDKKKGIVTRIVKERLISEEVLKHYPTLYIGSNDDIEYAFALGCRNIVLIDPIFKEAGMVEAVQKKLKNLTGKDCAQDSQGVIALNFDFGEGNEKTSITIKSDYYNPPKHLIGQVNEYHDIPDQIGMILLFASQSPYGSVTPQNDLKSRLVLGGVVLKDRMLEIQNGQDVIDLAQH